MITYPEKIVEKLDLLEVDEAVNKVKLITQLWGEYSYFIDRTFCVSFVKAKKIMKGKKFATIKGRITRIT